MAEIKRLRGIRARRADYGNATQLDYAIVDGPMTSMLICDDDDPLSVVHKLHALADEIESLAYWHNRPRSTRLKRIAIMTADAATPVTESN